MDKLSPDQRSKVMAQIRSKDTQPELRVRRNAYALGFRFRLHRRDMKGTPDLTFAKHKVVLFVHGCFWHQHPGCKRATIPKNREEFWRAKLARNVARDAQAFSQLKSEGWRVETIWECETKDTESLQARLRSIFFRSRPENIKTARKA